MESGQTHEASLYGRKIQVNGAKNGASYAQMGRNGEKQRNLFRGAGSIRTAPGSFECIQISHFAQNDTLICKCASSETAADPGAVCTQACVVL